MKISQYLSIQFCLHPQGGNSRENKYSEINNFYEKGMAERKGI